MPVHDYVCETCGVLIPDQYHPSVHAVLCCPDCGQSCEKSWGRGPGVPFQPFTVDFGKGPVEITSLAQVRQIERESESRARNGEGERLVFRAFSQDRSNYDVNTLEAYGYKQKLPTPPRDLRKGRR